MHALFQLALSRPALLAEHAGAYAELFAIEAQELAGLYQRRLLVSGCMIFLATVGLTLTGVSVLMWPLYAAHHGDAAALLFVAPALPVVGAAVCGWWLRYHASPTHFDALRKQLQLDAHWLQEAEETPHEHA